jgi:putative ATP-binding cassette transporter
MFLPQKPYVPLASLREAVSYPAPAGTLNDAAIREALRVTGLARWADRLGESHNWSLLLSGGEQQRLAFARALLHRPDWLFLDEATAALDAQSGQALLDLLHARLPASTIVSVTHHPEQIAASGRTFVLVPTGDQATLSVIEAETPARPISPNGRATAAVG